MPHEAELVALGVGHTHDRAFVVFMPLVQAAILKLLDEHHDSVQRVRREIDVDAGLALLALRGRLEVQHWSSLRQGFQADLAVERHPQGDVEQQRPEVPTSPVSRQSTVISARRTFRAGTVTARR